MARTPGNSVTQKPPAEGPWTIMGVVATIVFGVLSLVLAFAIYQVSELGNDLRATNSRIDQTYSTLLQQASDIGSIKGDLRAATDKITAAADRSTDLSNRLTGLVDKQAALVEKQDAEIASVQEIRGVLTKLFDSVDEQRGELIKIEDKMEIPTHHLPPKEK